MIGNDMDENTQLSDFIESLMQKSDNTDTIRYEVSFYCSECGTPWKVKAATIALAIAETAADGCPFCNHKQGLYLTHHVDLMEEIVQKGKEDVDIRDFIRAVEF